MENADILQTIAEVSVAFAGFTSIAAVLGPRAVGDWTESDLYRLALMLRASLGALMLSLLPITLSKLHLSESTSWGVASLLMAAVFVHETVWSQRRLRRLPPEEQQRFPRAGIAVLNVTGALALALLLLNATGFVFERESGPVLLGLYWLLGFSSLQFGRVIFAVMTRGRGAA